MNKERNIRLDIIKAIAIILVVAGHAIQFGCGNDYTESLAFYDNWVYKIIYSFHMPVFMCVSGWLFARSVAKYDTCSLLKNKTIALLIPIFVWGTMHYLSTKVILGHEPLNLSTWWMIVGGGIWFLWALVYNMVIVTLVHRIFKDHLAVYALIYIALFFVPNSWGCASYIFMYPYFVGMYLLAKRNFDFTPMRTNKAMVITALSYVVLLAFYNRSSYIYESGYYIFGGGNLSLTQCVTDVYRTLIGFIGSLLAYQIVAKGEQTCLKHIATIGSNSLGIYIMSGFAFDVVRKKNILMSLGIENHLLLTLLYTVIMVAVTYWLTVIIRKIPVLKTLLLGIKP